MNKNEVFFGTDGLTSTSANHIANLAKEYVQEIEAGTLNGVKFYSTIVSLIGDNGGSQVAVGMNAETLESIPNLLHEVYNAKSLIAWLREAIKAREAMLDEVKKKDIEEWYKERGMDFWKQPERPQTVTADDIIAGLNIKERNRIYTLQTKCATFGKFIHPEGPFSKARKALLKIESAPYEVHGEGRDALVYKYIPTCDKNKVEDMFFSLQAEFRARQAELNSVLHDMEEKARAENMKQNSEYAEKVREWDVEGKKQLAEFEAWKTEECKRIADLKILIPDHLLEIYNEVSKLGK